METILKVVQICKEVFAVTGYANISVPSYTTGNIGLVLAGKDKVQRKFS